MWTYDFSVYSFLFLVCGIVFISFAVNGFGSFARERIFSTTFDTKYECSNVRKTLIRSTKPALLQNPCYQHTLFSVVLVFGRFGCGCLVALLHFCLGFVRLGKCKCATKCVGYSKSISVFEILSNSSKILFLKRSIFLYLLDSSF